MNEEQKRAVRWLSGSMIAGLSLVAAILISGVLSLRTALEETGTAIRALQQQAAAAEKEVPREQKAIEDVLNDQVKAWNRGDLDAFMKGYWESEELTFFSGKDRTQGWKATLERYRKKYQAEGKEMGELSFSDLEVRLASEKTAWVRGRWKVVMKNETLGGLFTLIFEKKAEGWRIVHDHTSG